MNKWRSPTAERIYKNDPDLNVMSAGTSSKARRRVSLKDIQWADVVIVMEAKHKQRLTAEYPEAMRRREVYVLEIEDNYQLMDPELIQELEAAINPILKPV